MGQLCSACSDDEFFQIVLCCWAAGFVKAFWQSQCRRAICSSTDEYETPPTRSYAFFKGKRTEPIGCWASLTLRKPKEMPRWNSSQAKLSVMSKSSGDMIGMCIAPINWFCVLSRSRISTNGFGSTTNQISLGKESNMGKKAAGFGWSCRHGGQHRVCPK